MITVGLIGYGYWGKLLAQYLEASNLFELKYIYSSKPGTPKGTSDIRSLSEKEIEAIFIASPGSTHYDYTKTFLNEGKHVFCEKPLSSKTAEMEEVFNLAKEKNLALHINYIYLQSPSINFIKESLSEIGEIQHIEFLMKQYGKFYKKQNAFEVIGCHLLSVYFYLFPEVDTKDLSINFDPQVKKNSLFVQKLKLDSAHYNALFDVSLEHPEKQRGIHITGQKGIMSFNPESPNSVVIFGFQDQKLIELDIKSFDEKNNISNALEYFAQVINHEKLGYESIVKKVSEILEKIKVEESR